MAKTGHRPRTKDETARDQALISQLLLRGRTYQQISDAVNKLYEKYNETAEKRVEVGVKSVANDIKRIRDAWREQSLANIDEHKARELARIDRLEDEYWEAWERSKLDKIQSAHYAKITEVDGQQKVTPTNRVINTSAREGEERWLAGIQWCIERRAKLLGLDAPTKTAHAHLGVNVSLEGIRDQNRLAQAIVEVPELAQQAHAALLQLTGPTTTG